MQAGDKIAPIVNNVLNFFLVTHKITLWWGGGGGQYFFYLRSSSDTFDLELCPWLVRVTDPFATLKLTQRI